MKISVLENLTTNKIRTLKKFWEDHKDPSEDDDDPSLNFFDVPDCAIIAQENQRLVGMLFLYFRDIEFDNKKVKLCGVGGVVTHNDFRRLGIAKKMLKNAYEVAKNSNCSIGMLCTDIDKLEKLYATIGFVPLTRSYFFEDKNGEEAEEKYGMIAPINSEKLFDEILRSDKKLHIGKSNF